MSRIFQAESLLKRLELPGGEIVICCAGWGEVNEDAATVLTTPDEATLMAVADGVGGLPRGEAASRAALETLGANVKRETIERSFELANEAVHKMRGPACTLVVAIISTEGALTTLHAGDSQAMVIGGKGKLKHITTPHTVAGLGERAGLLEGEEVESHPERHVVTNALGDKVVRMERTSWGTLAKRDTVLLASDGLFDNLASDVVAAKLYGGVLLDRVKALSEEARARMESEDESAKPDDLTIVAWRRR